MNYRSSSESHLYSTLNSILINSDVILSYDCNIFICFRTIRGLNLIFVHYLSFRGAYIERGLYSEENFCWGLIFGILRYSLQFTHPLWDTRGNETNLSENRSAKTYFVHIFFRLPPPYGAALLVTLRHAAWKIKKAIFSPDSVT